MIKITHVCSECDDVITEPLCSRCLEREIGAWLYEQPIRDGKKRKIWTGVSSVIENVELLPFSSVDCIVCFRKMRSVCYYCVMKRIFEAIGKQNLGENGDLIFNLKVYHYGLHRGGEVHEPEL